MDSGPADAFAHLIAHGRGYGYTVADGCSVRNPNPFTDGGMDGNRDCDRDRRSLDINSDRYRFPPVNTISNADSSSLYGYTCTLYLHAESITVMDTHSICDTSAQLYTDSNIDALPHCNTLSHTYSLPLSNTKSDTVSKRDTDQNTVSNRHSHTDLHADRYRNTDADINTEFYTDTHTVVFADPEPHRHMDADGNTNDHTNDNPHADSFTIAVFYTDIHRHTTSTYSYTDAVTNGYPHRCSRLAVDSSDHAGKNVSTR